MQPVSPVISSAATHEIRPCTPVRGQCFRLSGLSGYLVLMFLLGLFAATAQAEADLETAVGRWLEVRQWVDQLDTPESMIRNPDEADTSAVCVILRNRGRVVGFGMAHAEDPSVEGSDLTWMAATKAINLARKDDVIASLPPSVRKDAGRQLTLEIETAGPLQALMGRTFEAATDRLRPGIDGLAMRHEDRWWLQFPAQLRLTNAFVGPERLYSLALASDLSPRQIESLRDDGRISLYAFETIDLAQSQPDAAPMMLISGDLEVVQADVTPERILETRDHLVRHILSRIFKTDQGYRLVGSFTPMTSSFDQKFARQHERAFVALALAMYSKSSNADPELAKQSREIAIGLLQEAAQPTGKKDLDPMNVAAWSLAATSLGLDVDQERIDQMVSFLELMQEAEDVDVREHAHDLVLAAAGLSACSPDHAALATSTAIRTQAVLPEHHHVTLLPWLSWIERDHRNAGNNQIDLNTLRTLRRRILDLQVEASRNPSHAMNAGGFLLKPGVDGVTSQSMRPAIFLLETNNDPVFDNAEQKVVFDQASRRFLRYLLQLSCREDVSGSWRQPDRILGGIRHSTWDARMDAVAQAMALMALNSASEQIDPR